TRARPRPTTAPAPTPATPPPRPGAYRRATSAPTPDRTATAAPEPRAGVVRRALASLVSAPGLGTRLRAVVVDAATGDPLYNRQAATPTAPASTGKLLTAAAVLTVHRATDRITTRVVAGRRGTVV